MRIVIAIMDKPNLGYARPFLDCWQLIVVCITSYATIAGLAEWSKARHLRCPLSVRRGFEPHSQHGFWFGVTELRVLSDVHLQIIILPITSSPISWFAASCTYVVRNVSYISAAATVSGTVSQI